MYNEGNLSFAESSWNFQKECVTKHKNTPDASTPLLSNS